MINRPKILFINYEFPPLGGGGGVAAHVFAEEYVKKGYDVDYITTRFKGSLSYEKVDGISVHRVFVFGRNNQYTASMVSMLAFQFFALIKGIELCFRNRYVCIQTFFVVPSGPVGFALSKIFSIKNIIFILGGDIYDPTKVNSPHRVWILRKLNTFLLNQSDGIIACSNNVKNNCIKYFHPNKEIQLTQLPYNIRTFKTATRKELGLREDKKYIIGIGRLVSRKGFDVFIRSIAFLDPTVEGVIIGDGPLRQDLNDLAERIGIKERVHFTGSVSEEKKFQYLLNSDIYVLSSIHEGFGIVLQEAMQVGLPIIATDNGGQTDFIKDGENGFLVPFSDERLIANAVKKGLESKNILDAMRHNNLEAVKLFSPEPITKKIIETFNF